MDIKEITIDHIVNLLHREKAESVDISFNITIEGKKYEFKAVCSLKDSKDNGKLEEK